MSQLHNQQGLTQAGIIITITTIALLGGGGWWAIAYQQAKNTPLQQAIRSAHCSYADTTLCKFFAGRKLTSQYTIHGKQSSGTHDSTIELQTDSPKNVHLTLHGSFDYETYVLGQTSYQKGKDNTWQKQTVPTGTANYRGAAAFLSPYQFPEPTAQTASTFKALGTETCGDKQCFKYQVINTAVPDDKQYIWFDDHNYQLQRMQNKTAQNGTFEARISYEPIALLAPHPVKTISADKQLTPRQSTTPVPAIPALP
jgi:hypothetical protein